MPQKTVFRPSGHGLRRNVGGARSKSESIFHAGENGRVFGVYQDHQIKLHHESIRIRK